MAKTKGIYKRGNVYWIRYAGLDGRIKFESSKSNSFKNAQGLLIQRKKEIMEGKDPIPVKKIANHTFKDLADRYLSWVNGRQKSAELKGYIIGQLVGKFGALPLRKFNTAIVEQLQTDNINRGIKSSTNNRILNVFKHMFAKAVDWEMVEDDTLKRVRKAKLLRDDSRRLRYLSKEECQELINTCSPHLKPIVITALNSGMRKEEILSLEWEKHIDLKHGFILLDVTKNGERRELPINRTLREALQEIVRRIDSSYVFTDGEGNRFKNIRRSFNSACRRAGIKDFRFHDLRHTFASHLVMAGIDITTVKELLGHKTLTMTLRYSHLAPAHKVKALDILDSTINGKQNEQEYLGFGANQ